jgi:hypothetical protein
LVPGWRWIARITARSSLYQLATLSVCTPSITRPSSSRRTGEPLRYATISGRKASAFWSWPVAMTLNIWWVP